MNLFTGKPLPSYSPAISTLKMFSLCFFQTSLYIISLAEYFFFISWLWSVALEHCKGNLSRDNTSLWSELFRVLACTAFCEKVSNLLWDFWSVSSSCINTYQNVCSDRWFLLVELLVSLEWCFVLFFWLRLHWFKYSKQSSLQLLNLEMSLHN